MELFLAFEALFNLPWWHCSDLFALFGHERERRQPLQELTPFFDTYCVLCQVHNAIAQWTSYWSMLSETGVSC